MGLKRRRFFLMFVIVLMLIPSFSNATCANASEVVTTGLDTQRGASEDAFGKVNIKVKADENVVLTPSNNSVDLGSFSPILPSTLRLEIVNGFEPTNRFNSPYSYTFNREGASANNSLTKVDDGLQLFFATKDNYQPSLSVYNMSFMNSVNVSKNDFLSLAISTGSDYNSSEGFFGVALSLRDQQGSREYVFIAASNFFSTDAYQLSPYFLGWSYGRTYPQYSFRYHSRNGRWFVQLALNQSFSALNLSSAWLDGLLIGGELFSIPLPYSSMQFSATLNYALIHSQPFSINQKMVNSTTIDLPPSTKLDISGISCKKLNAIITGPLTPSYEKEEEQENKTVKTVDVFYNITQLLFYNFSEVSVRTLNVDTYVNITAPFKIVRKCTVTTNNITKEDLTEILLGSDKEYYEHKITASVIQSLRVFLILYRFNAWMLSPASTTLQSSTKRGIIDEYFVPERNESIVVINPNQTSFGEFNIYVGAGHFSSGDFSINDLKKPLSSLAALNNAVFLATSVKIEARARYTIKCSFHSDPLYRHSTVQPFKVFLDNALFQVYTPLDIEAQPRMQIPLTLGVSTSKTYTVKIEYDSSKLKVDNDELMVYKFVGYEYFMMKPLSSESTEFTMHFIGQGIEDSNVSISFLISINYSLYPQIIPNLAFILTVLSVVYIIGGRNLEDWLSHRYKRKKSNAIAS